MLIFVRSTLAFFVAVFATLSAPMGCGGSVALDGEAQALSEGAIALRWGAPGTGLVGRAGRVAEGRYHLELSERPPHAAFEAGVAVAELVLVPGDTDVRLGAPLEEVLGVADEVFVLYIDETSDAEWATALAPGFHCALRADDTYLPAECDELTLRFVD